MHGMYSGVSSLGVQEVPWHSQILADQLTLSQPGGTDYAHLITTGTPGFSDLPMALMKAKFDAQSEHTLTFQNEEKPLSLSNANT